MNQSPNRFPKSITHRGGMPSLVLAAVKIVVVVVVFGGLTEQTFACPNCKSSIADKGEVALGFAISIVVMLAVPFSILTTWFLALRRHFRRFR